ncbi:MAG: queuosine precursor transporter [Bacteroidaceae bacterium]|nr:queuosine precursor transporter [Bacteroidaceae bacterium]
MNKVSENPFKNRTGGDMPLVVITALFVTCYLVSNIMAVKVIGFFGLFYFDAGTITFPFAYMLGDVLTEIWGYRNARKVIWITFVCNLLMVFCTQVGVWLPSPDYLDTASQSYNSIFNYVPRIVVASLTGFLLGELSNAWFMERIKMVTRGRFLWLRTIGSSIIGYLLDTVPFVLIAFLGTLTTRDLLLMMASQYFMKLSIEMLFGTPLAYAVILYLKREILRTRCNG